MSKKDFVYQTPDACIIMLSGTEALLSASTGATISNVDEEQIEFVF